MLWKELPEATSSTFSALRGASAWPTCATQCHLGCMGIFTQPCIFHGKPKLLEKATARRSAHRVMAKKKHKKDPGKKQKASRSAQGKQRQDRRDGWTTLRRQVRVPVLCVPALYVSPHCLCTRLSKWPIKMSIVLQVIKVPEGAVLRGCKKTRRKLREHLRLRSETHSQLRVIASLFVLRIFLTEVNEQPLASSVPQPFAMTGQWTGSGRDITPHRQTTVQRYSRATI
ncbi:hypothetical protein HaLaN_21554 [Haematococcus lacustris]|uniref:Uncharacterized protein n=1 Tax=Haematococcus lacustris TaxID=44745 RepID=A0A699ZYR3_HAELA|nr:hypothetical protein HaLaN_21554 [Haematococcus lacustris]